jgi:hypothetical protein
MKITSEFAIQAWFMLLIRQVRWLFNNEPITSPHFRISSRPDGTHQLYIQEVFDDDAGRFSVLAENDAGKATCSALLVVVDESTVLPHDYSPPETPLQAHAAPLGFGPPPVVPIRKPVQQAPPQPPPQPVRQAPSPASFREEIRIPEKPYQPVEVAIEIPVPPEFIQPLRDIAAAEGTRVTFEGCLSGGRPEPTIKWFRDGRPLTGGADFEITYRDGRVKLSIPEAFPEDSGKYTVSAQNKGGQASSTAELVVKGEAKFDVFIRIVASDRLRNGSDYKLHQLRLLREQFLRRRHSNNR